MTAPALVKSALTPAQELAAVEDRYLPSRAKCQLGHPLVITASRPSFHHHGRPCLLPVNTHEPGNPRRALIDLDRAGVARTAQGKETS